MPETMSMPFLAADRLLQRIFLNIACPGYQCIRLGKNSFYLLIFQRGWHGKIIPGQFQVIFCPLPAGSFHLAEPAMLPGLELAFTLCRKFCRRLQRIVCPGEQLFLWDGIGADVFATRLKDGHGYLFDIIDAVK